MFNPSRGGVRGGKDQFDWEDVKSDKFRENFLGHSVMAPVGRWQKGKDLTWYARTKKGPRGEAVNEEKRKQELQKVKEEEEMAMMEMLGLAKPRRSGGGTRGRTLEKREAEELLARGNPGEGDAATADRVKGLGFGSSTRLVQAPSEAAGHSGPQPEEGEGVSGGDSAVGVSSRPEVAGQREGAGGAGLGTSSGRSKRKRRVAGGDGEGSGASSSEESSDGSESSESILNMGRRDGGMEEGRDAGEEVAVTKAAVETAVERKSRKRREKRREKRRVRREEELAGKKGVSEKRLRRRRRELRLERKKQRREDRRQRAEEEEGRVGAEAAGKQGQGGRGSFEDMFRKGELVGDPVAFRKQRRQESREQTRLSVRAERRDRASGKGYHGGGDAECCP